MMRDFLLAAAIAAGVCAAAAADTAGPDEFPAWAGCDIPVLRLVEPALPPESWPGQALDEGAYSYFWRLIGEQPRGHFPAPPPPSPPPVPLGAAASFLAIALAVLVIAAMTRRRRA